MMYEMYLSHTVDTAVKTIIIVLDTLISNLMVVFITVMKISEEHTRSGFISNKKIALCLFLSVCLSLSLLSLIHI